MSDVLNAVAEGSTVTEALTVPTRRRRPAKMRPRTGAGRIIVYAVLSVVAIAMVLPFVWMVLTSLKTLFESTLVPPQILPKDPQWERYPEVFQLFNFATLYYNSIVSTVIRVCSQVFFCAMAGYAFAKIPFPGKNLIFPLVLSVMMVPPLMYIIPQFLMISSWGWVDTMQGFVVTGLVSAFGTFLMRQFFLTLPNELAEAARIDGAGHFRIFFQIMLPLAKSGLTALTIFVALWSWNDLMWPLVVLNSAARMTLPVGLATMSGADYTDFPAQMAGATMAVIPMIVLFIILQKKFIEGLAFSGSKQ